MLNDRRRVSGRNSGSCACILRVIPKARESGTIPPIVTGQGTGSICCRSSCILHLSNFLYQEYFIEREAVLQDS